MLSICSGEFEVEPYKNYKNRTVSKVKERMKNLLWGIKSNSLKPEDKRKLKAELETMMADFKL
jgi:hypothetical protein